MFESLSNNLNKVINKLTSKGFLNEEDIDNAMREIRIALLEADVSLSVVKELTSRIKEQAKGEQIIKSISPGQMVVKIVNDELVKVLGNEVSPINLSTKPPAVIMFVGLQGSGKTTSSAKLALWLKKKMNKNVLLASLDTQRPAAKEQLESLAKQVNIPSLPIKDNESAVNIAKRALEAAKNSINDVLILDTAGRLQINQELMQELEEIKKLTNPIEIVFVADSLTGQDAANVAKSFHEVLDLTSVILTRIDGDSRGGAALSITHATSRPIKYVGVGEKLNEFQEFHPDRIASRILGMGDVVSLVESASEHIDKQEAEKLASRAQKGVFDFNDLLSQLRSMKKMGGIGSMLGMIPGLGKLKSAMSNANMNEDMLKRQEAIILSMTAKERKNFKLINGSRRKRIAAGSGTTVQDINRLLKQFQEMSKMMKKFGGMDQKSMLRSGIGKLLG
ncbi:MAG: signal recognition particle protein [Rickettsiales bacterium]|jgi:signal recognition particle subunit SRP54|nr:signal recognition particle protein [Rickettsiales bacterium]